MVGVSTFDNTQLVIYDTPGLLSDFDQKSYVFSSFFSPCNANWTYFGLLNLQLAVGNRT